MILWLGEGVRLVLDMKATATWRMAGEVWRPVSSG